MENFKNIIKEMMEEDFRPVGVTCHYKKDEMIKVKEEQYDTINERLRKNIQMCGASLDMYKTLLSLNAEIQTIHTHVMNIAKQSHLFGPLEKEAIEIISKIKATFN